MKLALIRIVVSLVLAGAISMCRNSNDIEIAYPSPLPDSIPIQFMNGVVTSNELDFNSAYTPDGKSFYFCRSEKAKWVMYVTSFDGNAWSKPVRAAFNDPRYSEADPAFAPDGALYYISSRPRDKNDTTGDYDIWRVKPMGDKWSEPENVSEVNSDSTEYYVSFAANGNLYFASTREGGYGEEDLYVSKFENGKYSKPVNLGPEVNSKGSEHDPLITQDEQYLIFTSSDRPEGRGEADLHFSKRIDESEWTKAKNLGDRFNTPTYEYCPYLSPDNKYFFYSSESDVRWINAEYLFNDMNNLLKK